MTTAEVRERPILFASPMVRAIIEGRKAITRRIMKPQPHYNFLARGLVGVTPQWPLQDGVRWFMADGMSELTKCPYGAPGDQLWVREQLFRPDGDLWLYKADRQPVEVDSADVTEMVVWAHHKQQAHCPSIHMPRWASRITLEITDVRVERLQEITEEDAKAEGAAEARCGIAGYAMDDPVYSHRTGFVRLWTDINGADSWKDDPWVWVVSFKRLEARD